MTNYVTMFLDESNEYVPHSLKLGDVIFKDGRYKIIAGYGIYENQYWVVNADQYQINFNLKFGYEIVDYEHLVKDNSVIEDIHQSYVTEHTKYVDRYLRDKTLLEQHYKDLGINLKKKNEEKAHKQRELFLDFTKYLEVFIIQVFGMNHGYTLIESKHTKYTYILMENKIHQLCVLNFGFYIGSVLYLDKITLPELKTEIVYNYSGNDDIYYMLTRLELSKNLHELGKKINESLNIVR